MNILIVEDHPVMRAGLSVCLRDLNSTIDFVEAADLQHAVDAMRLNKSFDLVLFDLGLPGKSGVEALTAFREAIEPSPPIVVFSGTDDPETVTAALDAGAMGFIPKTSSPAILQSALRIVLANGIYVPPTILGRKATAEASHEKLSGPPLRSLSELGLTPRQQQVCALMVKGRSVKHIARELAVSPATIKAHLQPILRTLNVMTRTEAIVALHQQRFSIEMDHIDNA
jgi:DNA-binding NarL/FixJ family response regulator